MKNFKILSLAILSLFIFSCESDDDNGPALTNASLAGTYNVTAFSGNATESDTSGNTPDITEADFTASNFNNATVTFTESGLVTSTGSYTQTSIYTEDGMTETETNVEDLEINGAFTISGNSLIITNTDGFSVTVRNFSSNGLELYLQETEIDTDYSYEAEATYTLVRQ
ncbi:hypothetical protein [Nonlabens sp. Asnod3-A02]|uniref:hypothetical protein n=1 Tax=Nonlabens sp. Asnod3-A02 TaxID=3160579 RepID=UPI0038631632